MRKALFIGINDYTHINPLRGCVNDALGMSLVLERHANGSPNFHKQVFTENDASLDAANLRESIRSLFTGDADVALLYFAGHGYFDENFDEGMLLPRDYNHRASNGIRMNDILNWANNAELIKNKIIILDCCQAGAAGRDRALRNGNSIIGEGVTILTACKQEEFAQEVNGNGVFTGLMIQALHGGASNVLGRITPGSLYSFVDNALGSWEQRPVFKTNVSQFVSLRDVIPLVPAEVLRKLTDWFPEPQYVYPLDPSYEHSDQSAIEEHVAILRQLQLCNRHSLIEPVNADHMYYAAMNRTGCRLTALGSYYHELARKGYI
jgi:hypothetical protein